MTRVPSPDELLELWAGTYAPPEPSPTLHPSRLPMYAPTIVNVIGTTWQVVEMVDGTFDVSDGHRWRSSGYSTCPDAYAAALAMIRTERFAQGGDPGATPADTGDGDPLGFIVGLMWALPLGIGAWVGIYAIARWRGWL